MFPWMGKLYLPDRTKPPLTVYNAFPIKGNKSQIHISLFDSGYHSLLLCYGMFYVHKWDSQRWIPHKHTHTHTHTHYLSLCLYLFSPLIMKQTGLHSARCITSVLISGALQWIMFNSYSEQCCDMRPFCKWNPGSCWYAKSSKWCSTVQDKWKCFFGFSQRTGMQYLLSHAWH